MKGLLKILPVEDEHLFGEILKQEFEEKGHEVDFVEDGEKAKWKIRMNHEKYDIILTDLAIPECDGYDLTRYIRKSNGLNKDTKIYGLSAWVGSASRQRGIEAGMTNILDKYYYDTSEELLQLINESETS